MSLADVHTGAARLTDALEQLEVSWEQTKQSWNDEAQQRFEEEHLEPIAPAIRQTLDALNRLGDVLARVERGCGDDR